MTHCTLTNIQYHGISDLHAFRIQTPIRPRYDMEVKSEIYCNIIFFLYLISQKYILIFFPNL